MDADGTPQIPWRHDPCSPDPPQAVHHHVVAGRGVGRGRGKESDTQGGSCGVGEQFAKTRVDLAPRRIVTVFFERLLGAAPARVRGEGADVIVGGFAATVVEVAQHLDGAYVRACAFEAGSRGLQIRVEQAAVDVGQRASTTFLMAISSA